MVAEFLEAPIKRKRVKSTESTEILFILPKVDVIGLHDRERHRQDEVEFGAQGTTLIPLPYKGRQILKSQATSSMTSSQNVNGKVKWEQPTQSYSVERVWCMPCSLFITMSINRFISKSITMSQRNGAETLL